MFPFWWLCHGLPPVGVAGALEVAIEIITPHHGAPVDHTGSRALSPTIGHWPPRNGRLAPFLFLCPASHPRLSLYTCLRAELLSVYLGVGESPLHRLANFVKMTVRSP